MFEELKVLELASVLAGPAVGQFFAELGASVIKVENSKTGGDVTRSWKGSKEHADDRSAYFSAVNWGKKSIGVNLETPAGKDIVYQLVRRSDIVIASYKPGDAVKIGVDYDSLKKQNPAIIYGQVTGYGSDDPRVGYDAVIQAEAGFMFMNGEPGRASLKMPVALIDVLAAHHLKEGILLAMLRHAKTGEGGFVEVSLFQAAIASLANQATNWLVGGVVPQKQGSAHPNIAPYGDLFKTADDDEILLAIGNDKQFSELCNILSISEIYLDSKFNSNTRRVLNRALLHRVLQEAIAEQTTENFLKTLNQAKVPAGIVRNLQQVFDSPQAKSLLLTSDDRTGVRNYVGSNSTNISPHFLPPPHYGEHTIEILSESLQIDESVIRSLISKGSIH